MKKIKKIVIQGTSGFGSIDSAFEDKVTIQEDGISYQYKPKKESELNRERKWRYQTNSPFFQLHFQGICGEIERIMMDEMCIDALDAGKIVFEVTYADKTKKKKEYFASGDDFADCFRAIKHLVPEPESVPAVLSMEEDCLEAEDE